VEQAAKAEAERQAAERERAAATERAAAEERRRIAAMERVLGPGRRASAERLARLNERVQSLRPKPRRGGRRTLYMYCWAKLGPRATHISPIGSRSVGTDEQEGWRSQMVQEFRQQIGTGIDYAACHYGLDTDVGSNSRPSIMRDNPTITQWRPH